MLPELGQIALILALLLALAQACPPFVGAWRRQSVAMTVTRCAAAGQAIFVLLAFLILTLACLHVDFSVRYVAENTNLSLPWYYRIAAVWGGHTGSLLLWVLILNLWSMALLMLSRHLYEAFIAHVLGVLGLICAGFLSFTLFTSNPFERLLPMPVNGSNLNPLLQNPGMIFHPPLLYLGYAGFSISFAFAIAALFNPAMGSAWVRLARPWTNAAWAFLTGGMVAGSWWAYSELGWGGWWFWDPVENASFMPWLAGVALIHAQAITEKRGSVHAWTILLSILVFSLSLLGTFLVRSGILTSVHAFASAPGRGMYMLALLGIVVSASLLLYAWRAPRIMAGHPFTPTSRETALLIGNLMFTSAAAMVLLGTLFPLLGEAFHLGKISVGSPYFGLLFPILMLPVVGLLPIGPCLRWGQGMETLLKGLVLRCAIAALACTIVTACLTKGHFKAMVGVASATWVASGVLFYTMERWRAWPRGKRYSSQIVGMLLAHLGVAVFLAGALLCQSLSVTHDLRMAPGEMQRVAGYQFLFQGVKQINGPNWRATEATLKVTHHGRFVAMMHPQKRIYQQDQVQSEAAINASMARDLYVVLGAAIDANRSHNAWTLRIYYKPFVRWIWGGGLLMMLGGFVVAADRRLHRLRTPAHSITTGGPAPLNDLDPRRRT